MKINLSSLIPCKTSQLGFYEEPSYLITCAPKIKKNKKILLKILKLSFFCIFFGHKTRNKLKAYFDNTKYTLAKCLCSKYFEPKNC
ncbi:MAG: hypothetical protein EAZ57_09880 [Cytophagales bacterium]|nr:MAG: hypothetical protein EAZ67_10590 [Cytophagales bacterium]TAF59751.1 MAG: hypothetical protein EAZ57_09880 [Cytophagales bacterium]